LATLPLMPAPRNRTASRGANGAGAPNPAPRRRVNPIGGGGGGRVPASPRSRSWTTKSSTAGVRPRRSDRSTMLPFGRFEEQAARCDARRPNLPSHRSSHSWRRCGGFECGERIKGKSAGVCRRVSVGSVVAAENLLPAAPPASGHVNPPPEPVQEQSFGKHEAGEAEEGVRRDEPLVHGVLFSHSLKARPRGRRPKIHIRTHLLYADRVALVHQPASVPSA
jgi:hypothetical protein